MFEITNKLLQQVILKINSKIIDVIKNLNNSNLQIVLVVSSKNKLIGTITDGDIRRSLLKGFQLNDSIEKIVNKKPFVFNEYINTNMIEIIMKSKSLLQVPRTNKNGKILGLYMWKNPDRPEKYQNPVVIFAGGFGKRLMPFTKKIPKPMLKINGSPILEHIIKSIKSQGFENFIITTHYLPKVIREYFQDGKKMGVNINYINEKKPLGTAGSLRFLKNKNENIIAINGDILTNINIVEMLKYHIKNKSDATMAVKLFEMQNPYGVVRANGNVIQNFIEKPIQKTIINAGIYIINSNNLKFLRKKRTEIPELFEILKNNSKKTIIYPIHENWLEIGNVETFKKIQNN